MKDHYYLIVDRRGNPIVISATVPMYWLKRIAEENAKKFEGSRVARVRIQYTNK